MTEQRIPPSWQDVMDTGMDMTTLSEFPPGFRRTVYRVDARVVEGQLKVARQRHHEFFCDEPPTIGGQDRYPQPLAYFAAGLGFWLLTQVERYASMLKKKVTGASVRVEFDLYLGGSVLAGTVAGGATAVRSHLTIESPESLEDILRLVRLAKQGCFAEQMIRKSMPLISTYVVNGKERTFEVPETPGPAPR